MMKKGEERGEEKGQWRGRESARERSGVHVSGHMMSLGMARYQIMDSHASIKSERIITEPADSPPN